VKDGEVTRAEQVVGHEFTSKDLEFLAKEKAIKIQYM
jgi:hypothetical protein